MTHKEFYFWLEGYLHGRLEKKTIDILPIVEKMNLVKEDNKIGIEEPFRVPMPINPFPGTGTDPYKPPFEVYCSDKTQLND